MAIMLFARRPSRDGLSMSWCGISLSLRKAVRFFTFRYGDSL
jgi:hypothetical protein